MNVYEANTANVYDLSSNHKKCPPLIIRNCCVVFCDIELSKIIVDRSNGLQIIAGNDKCRTTNTTSNCDIFLQENLIGLVSKKTATV